MARKIDDIFNECYERMRSGESLESCLRSYPQYRGHLEPLLRTTLEVGRKASYIQPRPEFRHWARVRIESAQRYPRQQAKVQTSAMPGWLRHGWAIAVVAGIIVLLGTGSTMAASSNALPDQPLYPVKLATEQLQLAFAVSPAKKAEVETDLVNKRADELQAMANAGNTEQATEAAARYDDQYEKAVQAITAAAGTAVTVPSVITPPVTTPPATMPPPSVPAASENNTPTTTKQPPTTSQQPSTSTTNDNGQATRIQNLKKSLDNSASKSLTALKDAQEKASDKHKPDWQKAIDTIKERHNKWSNDNNTSGSDNTTGSDNITIQKDSSTTPNTSGPGQNRPSNRHSTHR
jgi:hypothetical protein